MISKYMLFGVCVCVCGFAISTDMDSSEEIKYYHWDVCDISTRCLYDEIDASGKFKELRKLNIYIQGT